MAIGQAFAAGIQGGALRQSRENTEREVQQKEFDRIRKEATEGFTKIIQAVQQARQGGASRESLQPNIEAALKSTQDLVSKGLFPETTLQTATLIAENALNTPTDTETQASEAQQKGNIATAQAEAKADVVATTKLRPVVNAEGEGQFATNEEILNSNGALKPVASGGGGSSIERMSDRLLALDTKALEGRLTPEEELESEILSQAVFGKRFSTRTTASGDTVVVDSRGNAKQVTREDGSPIQDIELIKEDRRKRSAIAANQQGLISQFNTIAGDSFDFVKDTQRVRIDSGRESVDDTVLTFMFARTLPGVGKEVAQGDLERLAAIPGLPERIVAGFKSIIAGRVLDDDVREKFKREIILHRSIKAQNVRQTIQDLQKIAQDTNTPNFIVPGLPEGSEFNPVQLSQGLSAEELQNLVKPGKWFLDVDGVLKQRPAE